MNGDELTFDANVPSGDPHPSPTFDPTPAGDEPPLRPGVGPGWIVIRWAADDHDDEVYPGTMIVGDNDLTFEADAP